MFRLITSALVIALLTGCATIPDVSYSYYPAKWSSIITVTQTVGCNTAKTTAVVLNSASVTTEYSSNTDSEPFKFKVKELQSLSADVDMTMTFTDDGRLKSINQSTTGQGEAVIKSAVSLISAVGAKAKFDPPKVSTPDSAPMPECAIINDWGGNNPVTLNYRASINSANLGGAVPLDAAPESKDLYQLLKNILPTLKVSVGKVTDVSSGPSYNKPDSDVVLLELQKIGMVQITISSCCPDDELALSRIFIPQADTYTLPIPKAALFGNQSFTLTLSEAGAVTSVGYGKTVGTAGALNVLSAIAGTQTAAAKAAELESQADLVAQQQRLVLCQTKPDQCE